MKTVRPLESALSVDAVALAIIGFAFTASIAVYSRLPEQMATHFDLAGNPNGYSSRAAAALFTPVCMLALWALLRFVPGRVSAEADAKNGRAMGAVALISVMLIFVMHVLILVRGLGHPIDMPLAIGLALAAFVVAAGLLFPRLRRNPWAGVRVPWTMASDDNWARTHRFAGKLMVTGGLLSLFSALADAKLALGFTVTTLVIASIAPIAYSYSIAKAATK